MISLFDIMRECNNFFEYETEKLILEITATKLLGEFENDYILGQYVRIQNSILNDGVYKISAVGANEITLDATLLAENTDRDICISSLKMPKEFLAIATEIIADGTNQSVKSESVSRYSVDYGEGGKSWTNVYKKALDNYRKMRW